MVKIELVHPALMPTRLDAYAVRRVAGVVFVVREDATPAQMAAAINRLGALL